MSLVQTGNLGGTNPPCRADDSAHAQVTAVEPAFNRLVLFDPRLPHGVREVQGTRDPRKGRLVVTGWFTEPTPFFTGALRSPTLLLDTFCSKHQLHEEHLMATNCRGILLHGTTDFPSQTHAAFRVDRSHTFHGRSACSRASSMQATVRGTHA